MDPILNLISQKQQEYRPLPLWSWNDKLQADMLTCQMEQMKKQGLGGFFMHARGGLETEYLSEDWLECAKHCIDYAKACGMQAWCYDENGWPSGFADGKVPQLGYEHQIKWIELSDSNDNCDRVISSGEYGGEKYFVVLKSNKYYVDTLSENTIGEFIKLTHEKYYEKFADEFGAAMPGFFTDEPQYKIGRTPWTLDFPERFKCEYGYDITDSLIALYKPVDGYEKVRNDYWKLTAKLFRNAIGKAPYDWCTNHGVQLTGHVMLEDNLYSQMESTGGAMGYYENFHIPGIDWLTRSISSPIIPKQVSSAAAQLGRNKVLSEMFALCGWDVSFSDLKWIADWQFVNGVNLICQHLEGYTIRGFRKRDYPASLFIQQPWWNEYHCFNDYFSRLGAVLGEGKDPADVLLLHPINSAYVAYDCTRNQPMQELDDEFLRAVNGLSGNHINYHFGDEYLMSKYASVNKDRLIVGECEYKTVVLPYILNMSESTFNLLLDFYKNGGRIVSLKKSKPLLDGVRDKRLDNFISLIPVVENKDLFNTLSDELTIKITENGEPCRDISSTCRIVGGDPVWFAVNLCREKKYIAQIEFPKPGDYRILNLETMKYSGLEIDSGVCALRFEPGRSYVITRGKAEKMSCGESETVISYPDTFEYSLNSDNALTLDCCEYKIGSGEYSGKIPIINLQTMLTERRVDDDIYMKFCFSVMEKVSVFNKFELVCERPEQCEIIVNGEAVSSECKGEYIDSSFKRIDIKNHVLQGENELIIKRRFYQRQKVYDVLFGEDVLETERNKLTYDTELESVYLVGDFAVYSDCEFENYKNCRRTGDSFYIAALPEKVSKSSLTEQGFAFYSGSADLKFTYTANKTKGGRFIVDTSSLHCVLARVFVNGADCGPIMFPPFKLDVTDYVKDGENKITLRIYSGNRNLLGPHHHPDGECLAVAPHSFRCGEQDAGTYCFVDFGFQND